MKTGKQATHRGKSKIKFRKKYNNVNVALYIIFLMKYIFKLVERAK